MSRIGRASSPSMDRDFALNTAVGDTLRELRTAGGLTITSVATTCGVSPTTIQNVEAGVTACPLRLLVRLAELHDCSLDSLVPVILER